MYRKESHRLKLFEQPVISGIKIMNKLPGYIKNCEHLNLFKKHLKQFLLNQAYYTVDEFLDT